MKTTVLLTRPGLLILAGVWGFWRSNYERSIGRSVSNFKRVETLNSPVKAASRCGLRILRGQRARRIMPVQSERTGDQSDGVVFDMPDAEWAGGFQRIPLPRSQLSDAALYAGRELSCASS